jgi:predicted DNA-binding transcriptional regulator AlpA
VPSAYWIQPVGDSFLGATMDEQIWTVTEVANYLKMSPRQVWELTRRRGQEHSECPLPCFKIHSKCLRFRKSDVQQWLETSARKARVQ